MLLFFTRDSISRLELIYKQGRYILEVRKWDEKFILNNTSILESRDTYDISLVFQIIT